MVSIITMYVLCRSGPVELIDSNEALHCVDAVIPFAKRQGCLKIVAVHFTEEHDGWLSEAGSAMLTKVKKIDARIESKFICISVTLMMTYDDDALILKGEWSPRHTRR